MTTTRREMLRQAGSGSLLAAAASLSGAATATASGSPTMGAGRTLPDTAAFAPMGVTYLDSGSQHPVSRLAKIAVERYEAKRTFAADASGYELDEDGVKAKFARLVNASVEEIAFVQSTTAGEQAILRSLGIPQSGGHIIVDELHFFGSIPLYLELQKQGMEVSWIKARDGRIDPADIRAALRKDTRLVALSLVSTINGFEHDLKRVCDIAHAGGALVYADIVHAAGCVPVDLHASGVDFAATASYKWLMGDFGLGFVYVRKDILPRLKRPNVGYYGLADLRTHIYPLDPSGESVADYSFTPDVSGYFSTGTYAHSVIAQLGASLDYIADLGVSAIQRHAQGLCDHMKAELPKLGYRLMTPAEARTPLVACIAPDARNMLGPVLNEAKVRITLSANRFRMSPSVFNSHADIERLLSILPRAV
ncbi:MAG: aminotransferase class V-fold PLP-dependent enzyme [Sphingobium sp.]